MILTEKNLKSCLFSAATQPALRRLAELAELA
jgi:hypothetical protein